MHLKMTNKFNATVVKRMLLEEDKFLSDIFSKMPLPITESEVDEEDDKPQPKQVKLNFANGNVKRAQTYVELHEKLNELKGQKKLTYKQKKLKKGLKNRLKKKSKHAERMMQKKLVKIEPKAACATSDEGDSGPSETVPKVPRAKPVFNSEGHMVFSKFDFSNIGTKKKIQKSVKDPKKILDKLKEKKEKLKELVVSGDKEKAEEIKEKDAWKSALVKASGETVKDDPDLLKRTIKRDEQQKKRSAKKWESRIANVEKTKQERQQKRQDNIMKRKKDKKTNKLKKASKKGRIIPGF